MIKLANAKNNKRLNEFDDFKEYDLVTRILYSFPWNALNMEKKDSISTQIGVLSSSEIVTLLKTNPDTFPHMQEGMNLSEKNIINPQGGHLVLRFKAKYYSSYFDIKYYLSCFPYSINLDMSLVNPTKNYYNIILPYPRFLEQNPKEPCAVFLRWKRFHTH